MTINRIARLYAIVAGASDFFTGVGLVFLPQVVLPLMGVPGIEGGALVFLRWVGAFVGAVGLSYWWALLRPSVGLRAVFELTILFRLAAGVFSAVAILRGWLGPVWWSVPATDFIFAGVQVWLLREGAGRDD